MIAIIDYGVGNLFSLSCSFKAIGADTVVTGDPEIIRKADKLVLPGVGAFENARKKLADSGLDELIIELVNGGKPLLGVCLGMQMLFEESHEYGIHKGLGLLPGIIVPIKDYVDSSLKVPHIGWNALHIKKDSRLFKYIKDGECVYYVHSYFAKTSDDVLLATSEYGTDITASVEKGNIFGCQFHPEKSSDTGLNILKAFCEIGDKQ